MKTLFLILIFLSNAFAGSVNGAYVEAQIDPIPNSSSQLVYTYRIMNVGGSKDFVKTFAIDVRGRTALVSTDSVSTPANWTYMGIRNDEITWASSDNGVAVGQSSGYLKLKSDGLPGIRPYRLAPSMENSKIPFSPPQDSTELKAYLKKVEQFKKEQEGRGITLAPVAPPTPFVPLAFIDILTQNFQEITSQTSSKNKAPAELLQKLKIIRTTLENNNLTAAKTLSENLVNQLSFQKKESLSPEVMALIKFNLQYFNSQISKK